MLEWSPNSMSQVGMQRRDQAKKKEHNLEFGSRQVNCLLRTKNETGILCWYEGHTYQGRNKHKEIGRSGQRGSLSTNPALQWPRSHWVAQRTNGWWTKTVRVQIPASQSTGCELYETVWFLSASVFSFLTWNNHSASCLRHLWELNELICAKHFKRHASWCELLW